MKRRKFLKTGCTVCVGALAGISALSLLESCASGKILKREIIDEKIIVNLSEFENKQPFVIVRAAQLSFDILISKQSENNYTAIYMQCSHNDNPVFANNKEIFCPSHGSRFDFTGQVKSEPATIALKQFKTELSGKIITVFLT